MTTIERPQVLAIECTPGCERQDGHPDEWCREGHSCWGDPEYIRLESEPVDVEEDGRRFPSKLGVMAHRPTRCSPIGLLRGLSTAAEN
jgi:hypothetical protein